MLLKLMWGALFRAAFTTAPSTEVTARDDLAVFVDENAEKTANRQAGWQKGGEGRVRSKPTRAELGERASLPSQ
jgi:hypothetical protein